MINAKALARTSFETLRNWYYQGIIGQVQWEAWHDARDMIMGRPVNSIDNETQELAEAIVSAWRKDHPNG